MPMKVTVCFNQVKVLVPCGEGDILVRELIDKAVTRYKKASGKPNDYWVSVRTVRTLNDGGILDPDDQLNHVADDREQLIADFEEQGGPSYPSNGDGASASSAGTSSPDIFQSELLSNKNFHHRGYSMDGGNDVVVTDSDISAGSNLTVRRGSEPALNTLEDEKPANGHVFNGLSIRKEDVSKPREEKKSKEKTAFSGFARDAWRQSLGNTPSMFKWLEAQERQQEQHQQDKHQQEQHQQDKHKQEQHRQDKHQQMERKEPLGGSSVEPENSPKMRMGRLLPKTPTPLTLSEQNVSNDTEMVVTLKNDGSPLGIHVVPDFDNEGRETGLLIQSIEPGGRISRDGRITAESRIVQINGTNLFQISFHKAQEIFRAAMKTPEVVLKVLKAHAHPLSKRPPPTLPKPLGRHAPIKPSPLTLSQNKQDNDLWPSSPEKTSTPADYMGSVSSENSEEFSHDSIPLSPIEMSSDKNQGPLKTDFRETSPTKRTPPAIPARHPSTTLSTQKMDTENKGDTESVVKERGIIDPKNTKKIGKQIKIQLTKGPLGLGFSVTTRDNVVGEESPIYIKNILPKGAAVTDGRLKAGDRLLEVNGIEMTGKTQAEAVSILRNTKMGDTVNIVVSRQETEDDRFKVPRELSQTPHDVDPDSLQPAEKAGDDGSLTQMKNKEILSFNILLNDTGSAGLGVSVKGKTLTTNEGTRDLGIFVKAVIHGGAASKDGRLMVNDQLIEVNNEVLANLPNTEAMERLRKAMQKDEPVPGHINLKVARKIGAPSPSPFIEGPNMVFSIENPKGESRTEEEENYSFEMDHSSSREEENDHMENFGNLILNKHSKSPSTFLDRILTGSGLRNESYNIATGDSFTDGSLIPSPSKPESEINNNVKREIILGELASHKKKFPPSALDIPKKHSSQNSESSSSEDLHQQPPPWLQGPDWSRDSGPTTEEDLSPTGNFQREGFGRQSMSEKRKAHIDPRASEFYQRAKGTKEGGQKGLHAFHSHGSLLSPRGRLIRVGSAESIASRSSSHMHYGRTRQHVHDKPFSMYRHLPPLPPVPTVSRFPWRLAHVHAPPPPTNLKRFSSLENLATTHDLDLSQSIEDDESSPPSPHMTRMTRSRGCNESFRAAVDRSYDPVPPMEPNMETVEEESSENGSAFSREQNSARSSLSSENTEDSYGKKKGKKGKDKKSTSGILKGIFRFGKGRKTPDEHLTKGEIPVTKVEEDEIQRREHQEEESKAQTAEAQRMNRLDQNRGSFDQPLYSNRRQLYQQNSVPLPASYNLGYDSHSSHHQVVPQAEQPVILRGDKIQQLRIEHQRRHQERHGVYPNEEKEEYYERLLQNQEIAQKPGQSAIYLGEYAGQRSRPQSRNQIERPNSRLAFPEQSNHANYQDYNEINNYGNHNHGDIQSRITPDYFSQRPPSRGHNSAAEQWRYAEDSELQRNVLPKRTDMPPTIGYFGNPNMAYRDPVHSAMAGKRTVQTLTQPNSAKV
ncbi:hypothetical protein CHS0354_019766 [Potamilus streckersoni]|uniref:PDZ domain-containing protein n=1 Tax=Potamilus streckersoni TaxID=2493646 RepID=A0AAE0S9R1_9BIVA|nr:hypothetical protein CHS0354_019766 [Potamilus streckersoni]